MRSASTRAAIPGQEIAARLHFRGGNKRHLRRLSIAGAAPAIGTAILGEDGKSIGHILYAANTSADGSAALGVLADTHAALPLATAAGHAIQVHPLAG